MLQADNSWRCSRSDLLQAIFPQQQLQRYRLVEISINSQLFHVDVQNNIDGDLYWSRYIFGGFRDVLDFIAVDGISYCKISVQSRRRDSNDYSIFPIHQVFEILDQPGSYFFRCADGSFVRDSVHEFSIEKSKLILVWNFDH